MQNDLEKFITESKARSDAATAGPWEENGRDVWDATGDIRIFESGRHVLANYDADLLFAAHARTDLPTALKIIEELRTALERELGYYPTPNNGMRYEALRDSLARANEFAKRKT